jgi:hypothetical protein
MIDAKAESVKRPVRRRLVLAECGDSYGGTLINIIAGVILVGLLGLAVWWVIKSMTEAGQQYGEAMVDARHQAVTVRCQANMRTIWQNLHLYAAANGSLPASRDALVEWSGNSRLFCCPAPEGPEYVYIPGQTRDMPGTNVLFYEPHAVHNGRCSVLRLGGQIELLTPEELKIALAATFAHLR